MITGLGFIGAGTIIITKKLTIKGLTTAAGLWTTGIVGIAIGAGYYELGVIGTALILIAETWMARVGRRIHPRPEYTVEVLYNEKNALDQVLRYCKDSGMAILSLQIHSLDTDHQADYSADVSLRGNVSAEKLCQHIQVMPGVVSATDLDR